MTQSASRFLICLSLSALFIFAGSSCKKSDKGNGDDSTPEYYISFKADGVQKKYTGQALASLGYSDQDKLYNGILQGYRGTTGTDKEHMGIAILSNSAITTTIYQDPQKAINGDGDAVPGLIINYIDAAGNSYVTLGILTDENGNFPAFPGSGNMVADGKVSVTKLTSSYIEGTFSGTAFLSTDATYKTKVIISDGKFILRH